jgi:hypothetical protein
MNDTEYVRGIIFAWEKRRIIYNILLLPVGLALTVLFYSDLSSRMSDWVLLENAMLAALAANACYSLAPCTEIYTWALLGWHWTKTHRNGLFILGLIFSAMALTAAAFAAALSIALSDQ